MFKDKREKRRMNSTDCLVLILSGGRGRRLFPLTLERSKPAIGFAGKYRLIDIPISNCINSGFNKIFILTQFLSASLHSHILHTYQFDNFSRGFVEILSAEQSHKVFEWFHGTADAVRRVLRHLRDMPQENILILSSDHLYKMDYRQLLKFHLEKNAEVTISSIPVDENEALRMGILECATTNQVRKIIEKPKSLIQLKNVKPVSTEKSKKSYLASMGIYLFKKEVLFNILTQTKEQDFGEGILPLAIKKYKVYAFKFKGYWQDIGTIKSYYQASLDLISKNPHFEIFNEYWPLLTRARFLPPSKIIDSQIVNTLISDGCQIEKAKIENSIIGLRSRIMKNTQIKDSIIIGNDYYQKKSQDKRLKPYIGRGVLIERAIVDKNVTIGDFCRITSKENSKNKDADFYYIRDGIVIIRRGVVLKPYTMI